MVLDSPAGFSGLLGVGSEPGGQPGSALPSGSGSFAGGVAPGDPADASIVVCGSGVLVGTEAAGERAGGAGPGLGSPHRLQDSAGPSGSFPE